MGPHESAQWDPLDGTLRWDPAGQLDGPEDRRVEHYFEHVRLFRPPPWDPSKGPFHGTTPTTAACDWQGASLCGPRLLAEFMVAMATLCGEACIPPGGWRGEAAFCGSLVRPLRGRLSVAAVAG